MRKKEEMKRYEHDEMFDALKEITPALHSILQMNVDDPHALDCLTSKFASIKYIPIQTVNQF